MCRVGAGSDTRQSSPLSHVTGETPSTFPELPVGGALGGGVAWRAATAAWVRPVCGQQDKPQRVFMGFFLESVFSAEQHEVAF